MRPNDEHPLTSVPLGPAVIVAVLTSPRKLVHAVHWWQPWHCVVAIAHHEGVKLLGAAGGRLRVVLAASMAALLRGHLPGARRICAAILTSLG